MSKATISTFTCDLCMSQTKCHGDKPEGWASLYVYHPDTDRTLGEKHICDKCARIIAHDVGIV